MPTAIVVGAGIAGLAAAIALRDAGYTVSVHDRAAAIDPIGAALSLWPNAVEALRRLGALPAIAAGAGPIDAMLLAKRCGTPIIGPHPIARDSNGDPRAYLATRSLLRRALRDALGADVSLHLGRRATGFDQDRHGASVTFDDGSRGTADLVIVADGIHSAIATTLLGSPPTYRGYGGVLAISDPTAIGASGSISEYWGRGERFGVGDCGGGRRYWFYMRDAAEDAAAPSLAEIEARVSGWPEDVVGAIGATPQHRLVPFAVHARAAPSRLGRGRVICVGDAAHAMELNLGQGACQAIEDAVVLGTLAARYDPAAVLPRFEAARLARVRSIVRRSASGKRGAHGAVLGQIATGYALRLLPAALHTRVISEMHRPPRV